MSFPRYPAYQPSGVEWLGEVPTHWEVKRLGSIFRPVDEPGNDELSILSVSIHDGVSDKELDEKEMDRKVTRSEDRSKYKKVLPGDLVYNMMRAWQGGFGAVTVPGMVSPAYVVARPTAAFSTSFVEGLLRTPQAVEQMRRYSQGVTDFRLRLYWEEFKTIGVALPPLAEQTAIAAFLDRETGKIDALVAEQRRLMELLKEKRQAVISHAVTRGLNPKAKLKPSGIEWLGDVPGHWELKRIKHLVRKLEQGWSPQCEGFPAEAEGEWGVLKVGCVNGGTFTASENKLLPPELEPMPELAIACGDLLISRANTRELVGSAAVAMRDYPTLMLCDKLYRVRFQPEQACPRFVSFYLGSSIVRGQIELGATGASASMLNIGQSAILELLIPTPPLAEQTAIVAHLEGELGKFDTLTAEAQRAIDLLQERRSALISAAVTGQIDVR